MSVRHSLIPLLVALWAADLTAQSPAPIGELPESRELPRAAPFDRSLFRAPIHTLDPDERLGAYGTWASGDDYKASFHDGFVFYPVLGRAYPENLPWRWRTESITVGDAPIAEVSTPEHAHTEWRYEYRYAGVTEAYDVRDDGVEQTFVIAARPDITGDLVVEGRLETSLVASPVESAHQALTFADDAGNPIVRYGQAFAIDAGGRRSPIDTSFDGRRVSLTVSGDWLAAAIFPVTIDPLTSSVQLSYALGQAPENTSIHREDESPLRNTMFAYSRWSSASDIDVFAHLGAPDFHVTWPVYADVTASWSSLFPDVTFVAGADRWVVAMWRHSATDNRVRAYFHDKENTSLNSGIVASNYNPAGEHASFPSVGGRSHPTDGTTALLAYRMDPFYGNSATSEIHAVQLDAANRTFLNRIVVGGAPFDCEAPDVNCQIGWGDGAWMVVFQARIDAVDDYDILMARVAADTFSRTNLASIGPDGLGDKVRPVVQGWDGRYLVAMLQDVTQEIHGRHYGRNVLTTRVDWPDANTRTDYPHRQVANSSNQDITHLNLAYDGVTLSHWCLTYDSNAFGTPTAQVRRLGHTGAVTESADLGLGSYHAAATWNGVALEFPIVNCSIAPDAPVDGRVLQHSNATWNLIYGSGCGPGVITTDTNPYPGSQFYRVQLQSAPPGQPTVLFLSPFVGAADLAPIGLPHCTLNVGSVLASFGGVSDAGGSTTVTVALPDAPLFTGDLYWQFAYVWPAAPTSLLLGATKGMRSSVR